MFAFEAGFFESTFWDWFITILTLGGILGVYILIVWVNTDRPKDDEDVETMGHTWDGDLQEFNNPLPMWWLNMFYLTMIFGVVYLVLYPGLGSFKGLLGWSQVAQYEQEIDTAKSKFDPIYNQYKNQPIEELVQNEGALKIGQRLYMTYCTVCHGSDAKGTRGYPNLTDNDWLYGGTPANIKASIMTGRNGVMPAAETNGLAPEDVPNVVQYVLSLSGREGVDEAAAAKGKEKFAVCSACHLPTGEGNQMLGAPNLTDDIWLYGGSPARITETLTQGRQGQMPAHGEFLGEAKVHLVAAYIYSLSNKEKAAEPAKTAAAE